jgi:hypothetical protein
LLPVIWMSCEAMSTSDGAPPGAAAAFSVVSRMRVLVAASTSRPASTGKGGATLPAEAGCPARKL